MTNQTGRLFICGARGGPLSLKYARPTFTSESLVVGRPCTEVRGGRCQVFCTVTLCYSSETVSLIRSGVRMAATKPQQSSCAHPSWCQGYRSIRQHPAFYMSSGGFELRASCLSPKVSPEFFSFISLLHTGPLPTFPLFTFSFPFFL